MKDSDDLSLSDLAGMADGDIDLAYAALRVARIEYQNSTSRRVSPRSSAWRAASETCRRTRRRPPARTPSTKCSSSRPDSAATPKSYYDPRNSYLNEVLARRVGIPITLAVAYMEVGRRAGLDFSGIAFPGHFLVRWNRPAGGGGGGDDGGGSRLIDVFNGGRALDDEGCRALLADMAGHDQPLVPRMLARASNRQILVRMLRNLKAIYARSRDFARALSTMDRILEVAPEATEELRDRGALKYEIGDAAGSVRDLERYLAAAGAASADDERPVRELLVAARQMIARNN